MPPLLAVLPFIIGAAGVASTGLGIANAVEGSGGAPTNPTTAAPTPPNAQALATQKALISQQLPNVVGATSGTASPEYDSLIAQILSGVTGQSGANASASQAVGQQFTPANSQPTNAVVNGQQPNISDFLSSFTG
jgi:hypothetical protein